jgi:hypothetical protein
VDQNNDVIATLSGSRPPEGSLGDRILRGELSESKIERAKASPCFCKESSLPDAPKAEGAKPKFAVKPADPPVPEAERSLVKAKLHALLASLRPQPATWRAQNTRSQRPNAGTAQAERKTRAPRASIRWMLGSMKGVFSDLRWSLQDGPPRGDNCFDPGSRVIILPFRVAHDFGSFGCIVAGRPEQRVNAGETTFVGHSLAPVFGNKRTKGDASPVRVPPLSQSPSGMSVR